MIVDSTVGLQGLVSMCQQEVVEDTWNWTLKVLDGDSQMIKLEIKRESFLIWEHISTLHNLIS